MTTGIGERRRGDCARRAVAPARDAQGHARTPSWGLTYTLA